MMGAIFYLICGTGYAILESRMFAEIDLSEQSKTLKFLYFVQLVNHLARAALVWPMYLAEDFIVFLCHCFEDDGDIDSTE